MLRDALLSLAGDSQAFHGQLIETSARLNRLLELDDIRALKSRLTDEVDALKRSVEQKQREEQAHLSELTERVGALQSTLEQTKNQAALDALTEAESRLFRRHAPGMDPFARGLEAQFYLVYGRPRRLQAHQR